MCIVLDPVVGSKIQRKPKHLNQTNVSRADLHELNRTGYETLSHTKIRLLISQTNYTNTKLSQCKRRKGNKVIKQSSAQDGQQSIILVAYGIVEPMLCCPFFASVVLVFHLFLTGTVVPDKGAITFVILHKWRLLIAVRRVRLHFKCSVCRLLAFFPRNLQFETNQTHRMGLQFSCFVVLFILLYLPPFQVLNDDLSCDVYHSNSN